MHPPKKSKKTARSKTKKIPRSQCSFRRSGLFVVDHYKANNPKNNDYCLNLLWLVAKKQELKLRTALIRSLRVRTTWTGSGPETTTSFKNSLCTALSWSLKVRPTWTGPETTKKNHLRWSLKVYIIRIFKLFSIFNIYSNTALNFPWERNIGNLL